MSTTTICYIPENFKQSVTLPCSLPTTFRFRIDLPSAVPEPHLLLMIVNHAQKYLLVFSLPYRVFTPASTRE